MEKYVNDCNMCQRMKNRTQAPVEKLKLRKIKLSKTLEYYDSITLELIRERNFVLVYIRKLNRELYTGLSTLYTSDYWSVHYYFSLL